MDTPTLTISDIRKNFGAYAALGGVSLSIAPGEFVALLGPNGAGKSTLIKILDGVYRPTSGQIVLGDTVVPSLAGQRAVGIVHQDLGLVDELSISENLRLGQPRLKSFGPILNLGAEDAAAVEALKTVDLDIPVNTLVGKLSPAEKALVAVARLFHRGARIMFVDEVTSTLPPRDAHRVMRALARSAERGNTIIMVSHKLSEVLEYAKRVVVLIDGKLASDVSTEGLDRSTLTSLLMNHERSAATKDAGAPRADRVAGDVAIEVSGAVVGPLGPVDLQVREGEVIGIGGLPGSGLHDLAFLLVGDRRPERGTITVAPGVRTALVPPHRETQGGFDEWSVMENATTSSLRRWRGLGRLLSPRREQLAAQQVVEELAVEPPDAGARFGSLSGGNKQKVIFARALFSQAKVLVLCEPTRGVDITTRQEIYALIRREADAGTAVVVLSSDAEDLLSVSDRLTVIFESTLREPRTVAEFTTAELEALL